MNVEQITIFLENQSGRLAEVASILADTGVNIRALSLADAADFGILRLIVDDTEKANHVLKAQGFTVSKTKVVGVEVPDSPGGLAQILKVLSGSHINVEYMYAFVHQSRVNATIIIRFDDLENGIACLQNAGIRILTGNEIYSI
jgi:hypothetical protein